MTSHLSLPPGVPLVEAWDLGATVHQRLSSVSETSFETDGPPASFGEPRSDETTSSQLRALPVILFNPFGRGGLTKLFTIH
jgi:hypothetical protein